MYIQHIEIDNFKSFFGKTSIPFETGFTTISGPNGSGKSNIIDSILFCLGLSTSRTMRAEKLTDLINNLSGRREASVSITFGTNHEDSDEKIVVSRRIKDNGAAGYTSTYYLNGKTSTLTEIHESLSLHNISPGAYNVLMQGDVTGIINMSPTERRKIIDEIAGVAEFDRKIEQAQRELGSVVTSIERFNILIEELHNRLTQLAQDRELALKYQTLRDEKTNLENQLLSSRWAELQTALQSCDQQIIVTRRQKTDAQQQLTHHETRLDTTRQTLQKLANEVKLKGEDQQIALKKQIEGLKGAIARKQDAITFAAQKQTDNKTTLQRSKEEIERLDLKMDELVGIMEGLDHQCKELSELYEKEKRTLASLEEQYTQLTDASGTMMAQIQALRATFNQSQETVAQLNREKADLEAQLDRFIREQTYLQERLTSTNKRHSHVQTEKTALETKLKDMRLETEAFQSQIQALQLDTSKKRVALNQTTAKLNDVHREFTRLDAQKRAYEEVNFGRSVDTILNADISGVHGTLAQLGTAQADTALALEIALGGRIKNIVVDDDQVAQEAIALLQQRRAGRATFLPLNKMRAPHRLANLPLHQGVIDYAINLIDFDSRYEAVFAYALGDTVVVDSMATARSLLTKYRMVTLDGSLLEKTGAMTGGSTQSTAQGLLSSGKIDQQLAELRQQLEQLDDERNRLEKQVTQAEIKLDTVKDDFTAHMAEQQRAELALDALEREWERLTQAPVSNEELEQLQGGIAKTKAELEALEQTLAKAVKTLATDQAALEAADTQAPTEQMTELKKDIAAVEFQIRAYESKLNQNKAEMQSRQLEKEFHEKAKQNYLDQMDKLEADHQKLQQEKANLNEEITLIQQQICGLEAQTGELDEELKRLQAERDTVQTQLIEEERVKHDLVRTLTALDEQILAYQARKRELQPQLQTLRGELLEAGLNPDELSIQGIPSPDELNKGIQKIIRQMESLGNVNMRAIEEYDEVTQRHQELAERIDTLHREQQDLDIKIHGYGELKLTSFKAAFNNVDHNFREIFADLSDGEGHLMLTNPNSPFEGGLTIQARPRGKKMLRLEAMSGGEKSLTALAFVFAFQRYMPAPFYAFDEVDMFLDGINAEKLANMVRKQATNTQFIVVSLRKPMIETSDRTVGVTQKQNGITKVTGVSLKHAS